MNRRTFLTHTGAALGGLLGATGCSRTHLLPSETRISLVHDLVGYWPLRGDAQDQSGQGNHGRIHGPGAGDGNFLGRKTFVEIPPSASLNFGQGDFTLCACWALESAVVQRLAGGAHPG